MKVYRVMDMRQEGGGIDTFLNPKEALTAALLLEKAKVFMEEGAGPVEKMKGLGGVVYDTNCALGSTGVLDAAGNQVERMGPCEMCKKWRKEVEEGEEER